MIVLSARPVGLMHVCENCHAVLAYQPEDIYDYCYIYCPVCKIKQKCALDLRYDGTVKKEQQ